jgi:hypothetical protein
LDKRIEDKTIVSKKTSSHSLQICREGNKETTLAKNNARHTIEIQNTKLRSDDVDDKIKDLDRIFVDKIMIMQLKF